MSRFLLFLIFLYVCVALLFLLAESVKKKSIKLTQAELKSILLKSFGYGTVMLVAAYVYYFLGIKTE